jgi:hypothetical protein
MLVEDFPFWDIDAALLVVEQLPLSSLQNYSYLLKPALTFLFSLAL